MRSVDDIIPMLIDMKYDFMSEWDDIHLVHDKRLDTKALDDLIKGLKGVTGPGVVATTVTTYRLEINDYEFEGESQELSHKSGFNTSQVLDMITNDKSMKYFVVIGGSKTIEEFITGAHQRALILEPRKWIVIIAEPIPDTSHFWSRMNPIFSVTDVAIVKREISVYSACSELKEGCQMRLAFETLRNAIRKVIEFPFYDFNDTKQVKAQTKNRVIAEMKLELGNERSMSQYCGNCDRFVIQSIYKHRIGSENEDKNAFNEVEDNPEFKVLVENTAIWSPFKGLLDQGKVLGYEEGNLKNRDLVVGIVNQPPLVNIRQPYVNESDINGTTYHMVKILATKMNFTILWNVDSTTTLGRLVNKEKKEWTGMIGKLLNKEVEIAANGYWRTVDRMDNVDFTFPFDKEEMSMMIQKTSEDHKYLFLTPFTWDAWVSILITVIVMGPLLWIVHRSSKYYDYYNMRDNK
ncbi:unnamed protein product, partial [Oppiella nova]